MKTATNDYFEAYRALNMSRSPQGVLEVKFHTDGGPLTFTARDHTEFVDAFYRISQDRANKVVILTGTGRDFIPDLDFEELEEIVESKTWRCYATEPIYS